MEKDYYNSELKSIAEMTKSEAIEDIIFAAKCVATKKGLKKWDRKMKKVRLEFMKQPEDKIKNTLANVRKIGPEKYFSRENLIIY